MENLDCIDVAQDRDICWSVVNMEGINISACSVSDNTCK
jgi:hypothetical protein